MAGFVLVLGLARPGAAALLECASGDVACLIAAIDTANTNGEVNTIRLAAGTYTLTAVNNTTDGPNGLPSITSALTIVGAGAENTIIERAATAPPLRLLHVAAAGLLRLEGMTIRGGRCGTAFTPCGGGGLFNRGTAIVSQSTIANNRSVAGSNGGGIANSGRLVIARSTIANNRSSLGGGIASFGVGGVTVVNSTISGNVGDSGGGLATGAQESVTIIGSTIANNVAEEGNGGGLTAQRVTIINSTLAQNRARGGLGGALHLFGGPPGSVSGGIIVNSTIAYNTGLSTLRASSALALQNTILSGTSPFGQPMCDGRVTSLGNNFFTDPACAITLLPEDQTGDPRLGTFTDDGTPGGGYVPLMAESPAIDAGNDAACLPTDQRGQRRVGEACDIGAIEGVQVTTRVDFDNPTAPGFFDKAFQGIDFGTGQWQTSGPYYVNPTNHVYFADATGTSRALRFSPAPRVLNSMRVYTVRPGILTLSDDSGQTLTREVATGSLQLVTTGWTQPATTVTVSFTNGWALGVDDISYSTAP